MIILITADVYQHKKESDITIRTVQLKLLKVEETLNFNLNVLRRMDRGCRTNLGRRRYRP